jgi:protein N-lysine methyltransferase METTL21D
MTTALRLFIFLLTLQLHAQVIMSTAVQRRRHVAADGSIREYNPDLKKWIFLEQHNNEGKNTALLAIEGRRFEYNFAKGEFLVNNIPIFVLPPDTVRDSMVQTDGDTGRTVWDAAVVLSKYMEMNPDEIKGKRVLELGAGTGLAGLAAAALGAHVDISDLDYCLPLIQKNIQHTKLTVKDALSNGNGIAKVRELDWTNAQFVQGKDTYDIVLGADIVWLEHLVDPLVAVMEKLLLLNPKLKILLGHQTRSVATDDIFFGLLEKMFIISPVQKPLGYQDTRVDLFELYAKMDASCESNT